MNSLIFNIETELLLFFLELLLQNLVRPPDRLFLEEAIDLLKRNTASLGDEEEGEEEGEERKGCEEHVHAVAHSSEHLLGEARHEEVEKPVAGGCAGLSQRSEVGVEELGVDDPRRTVPSRSVDGGPEVKEEDGGDTAAGKFLEMVLGWLDDVDVCADNPHTDGTGDGTAEEEVTATELVDQEEQPDDGHDGLDDTEDTGHDIDSVGVNTETLEAY